MSESGRDVEESKAMKRELAKAKEREHLLAQTIENLRARAKSPGRRPLRGKTP